MSLLDLPMEIVLQISEYLIPDSFTEFATSCKWLLSLLETRLKEHRSLIQLYSVIKTDELPARDGKTGFVTLLLDIAQNADIGLYPRAVIIGPFLPDDIDEDMEISPADLEHLEPLARKYMGFMKDQYREDLMNGIYGSPVRLISILFASLPKVKRIEFERSRGPRDFNTLVAEVANSNASSGPKPLSELQEMVVRGHLAATEYYEFFLFDVMLALPSLRRVTWIGPIHSDEEDFDCPIDDQEFWDDPVLWETDQSFIYPKSPLISLSFEDTFLDPEYLVLLLCGTKSLENFTLDFFSKELNGPTQYRRPRDFKNICKVLQRLASPTLQRLCLVGTNERTHDLERLKFLGGKLEPLCGFVSLRHVRLDLGMISSTQSRGLVPFSEMFPASIVTVTFQCDQCETWEELTSLFKGFRPEEFPDLCAIICTTHHPRDYQDASSSCFDMYYDNHDNRVHCHSHRYDCYADLCFCPLESVLEEALFSSGVPSCPKLHVKHMPDEDCEVGGRRYVAVGMMDKYRDFHFVKVGKDVCECR